MNKDYYFMFQYYTIIISTHHSLTTPYYAQIFFQIVSSVSSSETFKWEAEFFTTSLCPLFIIKKPSVI